MILFPNAKSLCQVWNPLLQYSFLSSPTLSTWRSLNSDSKIRTTSCNFGTVANLSEKICQFLSLWTHSPLNCEQTGDATCEYVVFQLPTKSFIRTSRLLLSILPLVNDDIFVVWHVNRSWSGLELLQIVVLEQESFFVSLRKTHDDSTLTGKWDSLQRGSI